MAGGRGILGIVLSAMTEVMHDAPVARRPTSYARGSIGLGGWLQCGVICHDLSSRVTIVFHGWGYFLYGVDRFDE
jgi:hypothetical protein